jgi:hypothetical protein
MVLALLGFLFLLLDLCTITGWNRLQSEVQLLHFDNNLSGCWQSVQLELQ